MTTPIGLGRMTLKQHKEKLRELTKDGHIVNPYDYGTKAGIDVIVAGGLGNGYRNDQPWYVLSRKPGPEGNSLHKFLGIKEMPHGYAPFSVKGMRCWVPVFADEAKRPCRAEVSRSQGRAPSTSHPCDNASDGDDGLCASHRNTAAKREAKEAAWKERETRSAAGSKIAQDAVDELAALNIKAGVHYHIPFGPGMGHYTGEVKIHAEDVLALLREVRELRELKGEL